MRAPIEQVVHLHEIEAIDAPELARILHLVHAERLQQGPDFAGGEQGGPLGAGEAVADHRFRRAVHRRRIDQRAAAIEEGLHDLRARVAQPFVVADIEGDPRAEADHGDLLAG
jgi:hypothetical protein